MQASGWVGLTSPLDFAALDACDVHRMAVIFSSGPQASTVMLSSSVIRVAADVVADPDKDAGVYCSVQKSTRCCAATANIVLRVVNSSN